MKNKEIIEKTAELAESIVRPMGLTLWDVTFEKEGSDYCLTIFIDRQDGVSIDDCETVSRTIDPMLDRYDYIECAYTLSVSSAGIERVIRLPEHFDFAVGKLIDIKFFAPVDGKKTISGILKQHDAEKIVISEPEPESAGDITILKKDIALCKIAFEA